jgi:hypothetical protein
MHEIKGFNIVAVLLALVLMSSSIGLACAAKPETVAPPPPPLPEQIPPEPTSVPPEPTSVPPELAPVPPAISTEPEIPDNYTTYTDESKYFSISYPSDWVTAMEDADQNAKEVISNLQSGVPIEGASTIFFAGRPVETELEPSVSIVVESIHEGTSTLDGVVEAEVQAAESVMPDYYVASMIKTTVDGREATIIRSNGTIPDGGKWYFLSMITLVDKTIWVVICYATLSDFVELENDLNAIVRSLRVSN